MIPVRTLVSRESQKTGEFRPGKSGYTVRMKELRDFAARCARQGGAVLRDRPRPHLVRNKSPRDLVTEVDQASQAAIREMIARSYPQHGFLGEEAGDWDGGEGADREYVWVVDPLDGTTNFVHGIPFYCVSVGLLRQGTPIVGAIYDPTRDECFSAGHGHGCSLNDVPVRVSRTRRGSEALMACSFAAEVAVDSDEVQRFLSMLPHARAIRRMGSSALNLAYVAAGRFDAYWASTTHAWDVAAGIVLIQEAGGCVTAWNGAPTRPLQDARLIAAATPELHQQMLDVWNA